MTLLAHTRFVSVFVCLHVRVRVYDSQCVCVRRITSNFGLFTIIFK